MRKAEVVEGIGIITFILGAAGIAGAIELGSGMGLALGMTALGITLLAAGLAIEVKENDKRIIRKHSNDCSYPCFFRR